nr:hypothetical protein [Tanacetum cinerariifolium]
MFGVDDLAGEEVVMETTTNVKDSAAPTTDVTEDEITMAQSLVALKSVKPKVVVQEQEMRTTMPTATTKVTIAVLTPRAKDENVKPVVDDSEELRKCIEIVPDDGDEVLIEATPISSRSPTIIDYKIHKEGKKNYFKIIRADDKDIFKKEKPVDDMDNILFRTLKTIFEHHVEDTICTYQQGLAKDLVNEINEYWWKIYKSGAVGVLNLEEGCSTNDLA